MTRPLYAPEPQGVRSASSSAFEFDEPMYAANRRAQMLDERSPFDRERDRIVRDYKFMTEREKRDALRAIDEAERRST